MSSFVLKEKNILVRFAIYGRDDARSSKHFLAEGMNPLILQGLSIH